MVADPYAVLGVPRDATAADIKKAYYARALRLHPDKSAGSAATGGRFQELKAAYDILRDPALREATDKRVIVKSFRPATRIRREVIVKPFIPAHLLKKRKRRLQAKQAEAAAEQASEAATAAATDEAASEAAQAVEAEDGVQAVFGPTAEPPVAVVLDSDEEQEAERREHEVRQLADRLLAKKRVARAEEASRRTVQRLKKRAMPRLHVEPAAAVTSSDEAACSYVKLALRPEASVSKAELETAFAEFGARVTCCDANKVMLRVQSADRATACALSLHKWSGRVDASTAGATHALRSVKMATAPVDVAGAMVTGS
eukprot:TRINITY_DN15601_c0_g1_i1.p1 TRINITY_DN15601_c0_g1~~TRINITY_DN15601_c0_g1_i1.p1  ORF type:complete len:315 (+),score=83.98 TRINITY_DN15601_c0_g1_i1:57-1001(+)